MAMPLFRNNYLVAFMLCFRFLQSLNTKGVPTAVIPARGDQNELVVLLMRLCGEEAEKMLLFGIGSGDICPETCS